MTTDLASWLLKQIAEDERITRRCAGKYDPAAGQFLGGYLEIVAAWQPARVLTECEAKRRIIDAVDGLSGQWYDEIESSVLCLLALPYADRPGYREEWRP